MEKKGSIPEIVGALNNPMYIGMINELLTSFGRIQGGSSGQILQHDGSEFVLASLSSSLSVKIGSFTRDTTIATGTQAVTGVGFQPDVCLFFACEDTTLEVSFGFDDGTNKGCIVYHANNGDWNVSTSYSIRDLVTDAAGGQYYEGVISATGSDGFTITWTRTGAIAGTLTVLYLALKV